MDLNSKIIIAELADKIGVGLNHRIMSDTDSDDDSRSTDSTNKRRIELPASVVIPFH